jgi:hypothetical protein
MIRLPGVPRPACAFGAKSPKDVYRMSWPCRPFLIDGQPGAARLKSRSVSCMAVPYIESISVRLQTKRHTPRYF